MKARLRIVMTAPAPMRVLVPRTSKCVLHSGSHQGFDEYSAR